MDQEVAHLRQAGQTVETFFRSSDDISRMAWGERLLVPAGVVRAPRAVPEFERRLEQFKPDVVHLHNPYPLISPWVIRSAQRRAVPVLQTVHNYRHACVDGTFFRGGEVCTLCLGRSVPLPAVRYGCYRGSHLQSAVMTIGLVASRPLWQRVDQYLVATSSMAARLAVAGLPAERMTEHVTGLPDPGTPPRLGQNLLFVGRLDTYKGVHLLLDAWERLGATGVHRLVIAGGGAQERAVRDRVAALDNVTLLGPIESSSVAEHMRACRAVVIPSLLFEGLPRVLLEALSHGRPVIATDLGGMADVLTRREGWIVRPTAESLEAALRDALSPSARPRGIAAYDIFKKKFVKAIAVRRLLGAYKRTVVARAGQAGPAGV